MIKIQCAKMNGLGNDFVVIDARKSGITLTAEQMRMISNRDNQETGGCDQILIIHPAQGGADVFMQIFNADGGEVEACGNGVRAVSVYLLQRDDWAECTIGTRGGLLSCFAGIVEGGISFSTVTMPPPQFNGRAKLHSSLPEAFLVNVGNPHAVFFFADDDERDLEDLAKTYGEELEHDKLFPNRANINFARINKNNESDIYIELRTWERGVGLTQACGTGACATASIAMNEGLVDLVLTEIHQAGGVLTISQLPSRQITMIGEAQFEFDIMLTL